MQFISWDSHDWRMETDGRIEACDAIHRYIYENETHICENGTAKGGLKDWSTCCIWEDMGCTAEGGELKTFKHHLYSLFNHCQDFYLLF